MLNINTNSYSTNTIIDSLAHHKRHLKLKWLAICVLVLIGLVSTTYNIALIAPRSMSFAFTNSSCISQPAILPTLFKTNNDVFDINFMGGWSVKNKPIFTTKLCVSPRIAPKANSKNLVTVKLLGLISLKHISINTNKYPSINTSSLKLPLSTIKPIHLETSSDSNSIFSYQIALGENKATCNNNQASIVCPINELNLVPGTQPTLVVNRIFKEKTLDEVFNDKVQILDPLNIIGGNTTNGNIIYDQPENLEVVFDKPLSNIEELQLFKINGNTLTSTETSHNIKDNKLLIRSPEPLKRNTKYQLKIKQATSTTENTLLSSYNSNFSVSGGPSVISHNTGQYGFDLSKNITIKFNQTLNSTEKLNGKIILSGTNTLESSITVSGNTVTINPLSDLPICTTITIQINEAVQNQYGVSGDSAWKHTFRTLCRRTTQIGTSVQGRPMLAHWFGSGPSIVVFIGGMHGNEKSSVLIMESWLDDLEHYAERIPVNRTIVVVTTANPDGYATNSRFNARDIDLNRNFPSDNWNANVTGPGYTDKINGGGTSPLSEPESATLANFINQYKPRAVLSFHAVASLVTPNGTADSSTIAKLYASKTPYNFADEAQTNTALGYTTTGDLEFWLRDKGIPNVLIELATLSKNEFSKNRDALWLMVGL